MDSFPSVARQMCCGRLFVLFFLLLSYNLLSHTSDTAKVKEEWVCECDKFDGFVVVCFVEGTKTAGIGGMRERERDPL